MKKISWLLMLLACILFVNCTGDELADNKPVDMSDLLKWYDHALKSAGDEGDCVMFDKVRKDLYKNLPEDEQFYAKDCVMYLFEDNEFFVDLPECKDSKNDFIRKAQDSYNSLALLNNVWSNFEVWNRLASTGMDYREKEMRLANLGIKTDGIQNDKLRAAAKKYIIDINKNMLFSPDEWEENDNYDPGAAFEEYNDVCAEFLAYGEPDEEFIKTYDNMYEHMSSLAEKKFARYDEASGDDRLAVILKEMNTCKSFDQQVALLLAWSNSKNSMADDNWIIAAAERLMHSKTYSPLLAQVWLVWRALTQSMDFGMSRDSNIPNDLYNDYRKLCFTTTMRYLASHPDDEMAKNCAAVLLSRTNLERFGNNIFGNQVMEEMIETMPDRFEGLTEDDEEEDYDYEEDDDGEG